MPLEVLHTPWLDYELIDSGSGRKLERFGEVRLVRDEPKAWWRPATGAEQWERAIASYSGDGTWRMRDRRPLRHWKMHLDDITLEAKLTDGSRHVGVFPEQMAHWQWLRDKLRTRPEARVLNLFGYTGVASLVAAAAGARVTHVDASKPAIAWARQNQVLSGLGTKPVRWLLDDAFKFVSREIRRGKVYDAILLDPPSFGRGPKGEIWKVEQQIVDFLGNLRQLLSAEPLCCILTMYNLEASSIMLENLLEDLFPAGAVTAGELVLVPTFGCHRLPLSLFARWSPSVGA